MTETPAQDQTQDAPTGDGRSAASRLLTVRNLVLTTALTALVSAGVTGGLQLASRAVPSGPGVSVNVLDDPDQVPAFGPPISLVLPRDARTDGSPGPECGGFYAWAKQRGGADLGTTRLQVVVRGTGDGTVVINGMRVVIDTRVAPVGGIAVICPTAGDLSQRKVTIDLDRAAPSAHYEAADGRAFGFTVANGEVESFLVTATTVSHLVSWHLELELVSGGETRTVRVDRGGEPFTTAAAPAGGGWEWNYQDAWSAPGHATVPAGQQLPALGG
jgi:hypothetical protein